MAGRGEKSHFLCAPAGEAKSRKFSTQKGMSLGLYFICVRSHKTEIVFLCLYYVLMNVFIFPSSPRSIKFNDMEF